MRKSTRNDALLILFSFTALHCVRLSCTSLTVCEYGSIVACQDTLNDRKSCLFEDIWLQTSRLEGQIEAKDSFFLSNILLIMDGDLSSFGVNFHDLFEAFGFFSWSHGSASDCYLNALFFSHE